jgi:sugar-specific transcriptional regulator TrmB
MADVEGAIVENLVKLGLTHNEGKIYLYILKNPNSNGYEISKSTAISRSLVYGGLEKLKNLGFIELTQSSSSSYIAKSVDEIEHNINLNFKNSMMSLRRNLEFLHPEKMEDPIVMINNRSNQLKKLSFMIQNAKKYLYISAGMREIEWIRHDLAELSPDVEVHVFSFSNVEEFAGKFHTYSRNWDVNYIQSLEPLKDNWRIMVIKDDEEMFLCGGEGDDVGVAIYTKNIMMVNFAIEHFIHDVKIYNIEKKFSITDDTHSTFYHPKNSQ